MSVNRQRQMLDDVSTPTKGGKVALGKRATGRPAADEILPERVKIALHRGRRA